MEKEFWRWHRLETTIEHNGARPFFYPREIWFSALGINIGHEEDGKGSNFLRPVIVIKKLSSETFWAVPLTSRAKKGPHDYEIETVQESRSTAILSQLRMLDSKRLVRKAGRISRRQLREIKENIKAMLE